MIAVEKTYECRRCGSRFSHWSARCIGELGRIDPATDRYVPSGLEHDPEPVREVKR